jgi:hypothetical protein
VAGRRLWFDTRVDADARRIIELERRFRRDGLPNLIVGWSAADDVFTQSVPVLALVFILEIVHALRRGAGTALALAGAAVALLAFGLLKVVRGRRFRPVPRRAGMAAVAAFVTLPAVLAVVLRGHLSLGLTTVVVNVVVLFIVYVVVGLGLPSIGRWVAVRFAGQLRASVTVLARALPLLLFFSLVSFFTTEIWQVFTSSGTAAYWTAIAMFVLLGTGFLLVRLPGVVREITPENVGGLPLRRRERVNLATVALTSEALQVFFISAAVWVFYVILGALLVSAGVRDAWLLQPEDVVWEIAWLGERVQVTSALLRVATGVAAFAGLYYAVAILLDSGHRDQFVDALGDELHDTFERRSEYLALLSRRGGDAAVCE